MRLEFRRVGQREQVGEYFYLFGLECEVGVADFYLDGFADGDFSELVAREYEI